MWLEVVQEGEDIMRLSSPAPVILVDSQEVADEISCVLPKSENSKSTEIESLLKVMAALVLLPMALGEVCVLQSWLLLLRSSFQAISAHGGHK